MNLQGFASRQLKIIEECPLPRKILWQYKRIPDKKNCPKILGYSDAQAKDKNRKISMTGFLNLNSEKETRIDKSNAELKMLRTFNWLGNNAGGCWANQVLCNISYTSLERVLLIPLIAILLLFQHQKFRPPSILQQIFLSKLSFIVINNNTTTSALKITHKYKRNCDNTCPINSTYKSNLFCLCHTILLEEKGFTVQSK